MFAKLTFSLILFSFYCLGALCTEADPKAYPKILNYAIQQADKAAANDEMTIRYFKCNSFSISPQDTGKQYNVWLLYLTKEGYQFFYQLTIYENPWGELSLMDIEQSSRLLGEVQTFLP